MSAKRSNQKVIQQKYPMLYLIPLIAVLAVIPALLYECDVNTGLTKYNWYTGSQTTIDFFLYVKAIWRSWSMVVSALWQPACRWTGQDHFGGFMNNMNQFGCC